AQGRSAERTLIGRQRLSCDEPAEWWLPPGLAPALPASLQVRIFLLCSSKNEFVTVSDAILHSHRSADRHRMDSAGRRCKMSMLFLVGQSLTKERQSPQ